MGGEYIGVFPRIDIGVDLFLDKLARSSAQGIVHGGKFHGVVLYGVMETGE
jgi:hypothetical protein